ncbi:MAG: hypothetical protein WC716_00550 [Chitinophagaceae bacterium]|jgi:hypothetical protein
MNKDMINIDDFVREKLGGHTEKEDPAAWLRMKDLLDKEMPEKAAPFIFRLGKPMAFLGAALLIGALCVGGYKINALREKTSGTTATGTNTNSNNQNTVNKIFNNNTTKAPVNTTLSTEKHQAENDTNPIASRNNTDQNAQTTNANANRSDLNTNQIGNGNQVANSHRHLASGTTVANSTNHKSNKQSANRLNSGSVDNTDGSNENNAATGTNSSRDHSRSIASSNGHKNDKSVRSNSVRQNTFASNTGSVNKKTVGKDLNKNKSHTGISSDDNNSKNKVASDNADVEINTASKDTKKDSMSAITVITKQSTAKGFPKRKTMIKDTVNISKFELPSNTTANQNADPINTNITSTMQPSKKDIKLAANQSKKANKISSKQTAANQENILASKQASTKEQSQNMTSSKTETAKAKKGKGSLSKWVEGLNLPEAVASAKEDARNAQFYTGFAAGINYTPSGNGNNFQGVQFGPTGELVFNKHWSLFGAVKYFNRSGGKKTINDNFAKEVSNNVADSVKGANTYFTVLTDSTNRYFNFSTVHSFEMPISVRYAINKFYLMTGINLAYSLPVNVELVEKEYKSMNSRVVQTNTTSKPMLSESKSILTTADFGSRFGIGYLVGAGYQITPAWQTDLRMVNTFWDNAKGDGAKRLSKDFYRLPSIQITVGYQFNRGRSKATFGPNSIR